MPRSAPTCCRPFAFHIPLCRSFDITTKIGMVVVIPPPFLEPIFLSAHEFSRSLIVSMRLHPIVLIGHGCSLTRLLTSFVSARGQCTIRLLLIRLSQHSPTLP